VSALRGPGRTRRGGLSVPGPKAPAATLSAMRIALVSPYSWTYPGGVTRHIEALAGQFLAQGHDVRVLAPFDPPDARAARLHRGAWPVQRERPEWLVPLGGTIGFPSNGAVSNLAWTPTAVANMRRALRDGRFDVVHIHEPVAPWVAYGALDASDVALVGTFHCYSENAISNGLGNVLAGARRKLNRLHVRIAVSEAAAWTGRRFYGGEYRVIPNGVDVPASGAARSRDPRAPLRIAFVGQAVERKGLPVLLRAFEALREHVPAELVLVGAGPEDVAPLLLDDAQGITALGKVDDARKAQALADADVLAAPSLGGESFGMVLTEAFAGGTPVVASDIAGYRDVVRDGVDGLLVPRGDATALAAALRDVALDEPRRAALAARARERAERFAWPAVAGEVLGAYEDAIAAPKASTAAERVGVFLGAVPADLSRPRPPQRLPSLEPELHAGRSRLKSVARKAALGSAGVIGAGASYLALQRIGLDRIAHSLLAATPIWVIVALGLMCLSMVVRGAAWHAILRAALPGARLRLSDALQGTFVGVLMSATLPARLGEPSRALLVARRTGRPRESLPTVIGTIVSQTLLNVLALVLLGAVMFSTVDLFDQRHRALMAFALAPMAVLAAVLLAPALLRGGLPSRSRRVQAAVQRARGALVQVRAGLKVFRAPRLGASAAALQLGAWAVQWLSCYALLVALGLDAQAGLGAAAAVLFAVNVTAVLPATPSNLGVFQAACVAVLHGAYGVGSADALAYGIILQAVEIATAVVMGAPALVREGLSWRDVRLRALHATPVELPPLPAGRRPGARVEA
jgi:phosphatidylinositol alpha-mannosyltransferase